MTHKYKVGDKIRMLEDTSRLVKGFIYEVSDVDENKRSNPVCIDVSEFDIRVRPHVRTFELVTEETAPEQDNTDLTENCIPFGLLKASVKKRMASWEHGYELWQGGEWINCLGRPPFNYDYTYRAKPAPVEPERVTVWVNVYEEHIGSVKDSRKDADAWGLDDRIALWRITYDKETGLNPVIEVEDAND